MFLAFHLLAIFEVFDLCEPLLLAMLTGRSAVSCASVTLLSVLPMDISVAVLADWLTVGRGLAFAIVSAWAVAPIHKVVDNKTEATPTLSSRKP